MSSGFSPEQHLCQLQLRTFRLGLQVEFCNFFYGGLGALERKFPRPFTPPLGYDKFDGSQCFRKKLHLAGQRLGRTKIEIG